jgi:GntR family transcriptional regulator, transcriptional repressor for pyruvate dehydrogenase complex
VALEVTGRSTQREKPQQIADEIRAAIVAGDLSEGDSLGHEPDLVQRFGVSRPSLREALRILEAEGLITVVRGVFGGVIVHEPDERLTARTAALVLQARNVPVADVHAARSIIEPAAARLVAELTTRVSASRELRWLIQDQEDVFHEPERFGRANARFHERLVALTGNQTLSLVAAMLNEVIARAVTAMAQPATSDMSTTSRRRGLTSQTKLVELIAQGRGDEAELHWRAHLKAVGRIMFGRGPTPTIDRLHHG